MCAIGDLSFQSLFCIFLYSKKFWLFPIVQKKVSASLYSFLSFFPFSGTFLEHRIPHMHLLPMQTLPLPGPVGHPAPTSTWARRQNAFGKRQTCLGWSAHAQKAQCALSAPHSLVQTPSMTSEPRQASLGTPTPTLPVCLPAKLGCPPLGGTTKHSPVSLETNLSSSQRDPKAGMVWCPQSCTGAACPLLQDKTQESCKTPPE